MDDTTATAVTLNTLQNAVSAISVDIMELKRGQREMNAKLDASSERLSAGLASILEWRAAHDAATGPRVVQHDQMVGRIAALEIRAERIEDRQTTSRMLLLPTIAATLAAFFKAFFFKG